MSTQWWWETTTGGDLSGRAAFTRLVARASPGVKGPLGGLESPLLEAFLPSKTVTGEPGRFIRSLQGHDPLRASVVVAGQPGMWPACAAPPARRPAGAARGVRLDTPALPAFLP